MNIKEIDHKINNLKMVPTYCDDLRREGRTPSQEWLEEETKAKIEIQKLEALKQLHKPLAKQDTQVISVEEIAKELKKIRERTTQPTVIEIADSCLKNIEEELAEEEVLNEQN